MLHTIKLPQVRIESFISYCKNNSNTKESGEHKHGGGGEGVQYALLQLRYPLDPEDCGPKDKVRYLLEAQ